MHDGHAGCIIPSTPARSVSVRGEARGYHQEGTMAGEMIINANENLIDRPFGQPWGLPVEYNGQYGPGWRTFIGGHGILLSATTETANDQDGNTLFTVTFDGSFT